MNNLFFAIISATIMSLVSLIGVFSILVKKQEILNKIIFLLVGFAAGVLIGGAFFHLLPESLGVSYDDYVFLYLVLGFIIFFILEKFILWRHCHEDICDVHPFGTINLIGSGVHIFIDGIIIFAAFSRSIDSGITVSLAILFHEIPHKLGDFGILVYSGLNIYKALFFNFLSATPCVFGVLFCFIFFSKITNFSAILMSVAAGEFLYIAASDLIPELHRQKDIKRSNLAFIMFILGLILMWILKNIHIH